jgi:hypothetical protein
MREYLAETSLAHCACDAARYATPTTLYDVNGTLVIAMPFYRRDGRHAPMAALRRFLADIRNHNAHCTGAKVMDLLESNYRLDGRGNIRIVDMNLDENDYSWLIESANSGRLWTI